MNKIILRSNSSPFFKINRKALASTDYISLEYHRLARKIEKAIGATQKKRKRTKPNAKAVEPVALPLWGPICLPRANSARPRLAESLGRGQADEVVDPEHQASSLPPPIALAGYRARRRKAGSGVASGVAVGSGSGVAIDSGVGVAVGVGVGGVYVNSSSVDRW